MPTCWIIAGPNDGENPVLVFEQQGEQREIIDSNHYHRLLQGAGQ